MTTIAPPAAADWPALARLHADGLPHGFFAQLGPRFLVAYLRTFADGPLGVALVARRDDEVVGFVVGSVRSGAHSRWVVRHRGIRLSLLAVVSMLARPWALRTFVQTRLGRYAKGIWLRVRPSTPRADRTRASSASEGERDVAVLRHVVVAPAARGHGVGGSLVEAFTDVLGREGATRVRLITRADGEGAAGLYERLGWTRVRGRRAADGTFVLEYALDLS